MKCSTLRCLSAAFMKHDLVDIINDSYKSDYLSPTQIKRLFDNRSASRAMDSFKTAFIARERETNLRALSHFFLPANCLSLACADIHESACEKRSCMTSFTQFIRSSRGMEAARAVYRDD